MFDPCRPYLDTFQYEEKCRFDFCALDELRDILLADCGVAAAYVQQCRVSELNVIPQKYDIFKLIPKAHLWSSLLATPD